MDERLEDITNKEVIKYKNFSSDTSVKENFWSNPYKTLKDYTKD